MRNIISKIIALCFVVYSATTMNCLSENQPKPRTKYLIENCLTLTQRLVDTSKSSVEVYWASDKYKGATIAKEIISTNDPSFGFHLYRWGMTNNTLFIYAVLGVGVKSDKTHGPICSFVSDLTLPNRIHIFLEFSNPDSVWISYPDNCKSGRPFIDYVFKFEDEMQVGGDFTLLDSNAQYQKADSILEGLQLNFQRPIAIKINNCKQDSLMYRRISGWDN